MNEETRRSLWIATAAVIAAQFLVAVFTEHRRLQRWLREYELAMDGRRNEIRARALIGEGLIDAED